MQYFSSFIDSDMKDYNTIPWRIISPNLSDGAQFNCFFHPEETMSARIEGEHYLCDCCGIQLDKAGLHAQLTHSPYEQASAFIKLMNNEQLTRSERTNLQSQYDAFSIHRRLHEAFANHLKESKVALDYLATRGFSHAQALDAGIGFCPYNAPIFDALSKEYSTQFLTEIGVLNYAEKRNSYYSPFSNRITFTICNAQHLPCGFGGRIVDPKTTHAKYINSATSSIFNKSRLLFSTPQTKNATKACVFEGYMDNIKYDQLNGQYAAYAVLGVAASASNIRKLTHEYERVVFCLDGDSAGARGLKSILATLEDDTSRQSQAYFCFAPEQLDPDEYIQKHGITAFDDLLDSAMSFEQAVEYTVKNSLDAQQISDMNHSQNKDLLTINSRQLVLD